MTKTCLDMFAGLGGFSAAFEESPEWEVVTVEIEEELEPDIQADVMDLRPSDLPDAQVVLASVPCLLFSPAGNHDEWDMAEKKPVGDRAKEHVCLAMHTVGLIKAIAPDYWFLENPRGRLRWILGEPTGTVTYCAYGKDYQKPTDLWGDHPDGMTYRSCPTGGECHTRSVADDGTSAVDAMPSDYGERSKVPYELSQSILKAVEGRTEQTTLPSVAP